MPKQADRTYFNPGDTLWFCGRGFASRAIALGTCSFKQLLFGQWFSHCGIIAQHRGRLKHFESTTFHDKACDIRHMPIHGVQANDPWLRINDYKGRVYLARPRKAFTLDQSERLTNSLTAFIGRPYDMRQALLSGTTWIKKLQDPDETLIFCDELIGMSLIDSGKLSEGTFNPSEQTPSSLLRMLVRHWAYLPPVWINRGK